MLCEKCGNANATTHLKRTVNGKTQEYHLCAKCASELGVSNFNPFDISDLWGSLFGDELPSAADSVRCKSCNSSFDEIAKRGKLGCPECYKTFYDKLLPSLRKLHGKTHHMGRVPDSADENAKNAYRLTRLKEQLKSAVEDEEYEKAAQLRDEIRTLESGGEDNE